MVSVKQLRQNGFKVQVHHVRKEELTFDITHENKEAARRRKPYMANVNTEYLPRGGKTYVKVTNPNGVTYDHVARCRPDENYNKKIGVQTALDAIMVKFAEEA